MIEIQEKAAFLLNKHQIVAALEANILYRIKEIEEKNGTVTREVTVNDGRYDGDKRDELNRLRMLLLKGQEEKTLIETKLLKCQEEKNQLGSENSNLYNENIKLFSECEKKDSIIAAQQKDIEELRNASAIAIARDTEQATQNKIIQSLREQLQNEKQENARNKKELRELKKSLQSTADKVTGESRRKNELSTTVQQQKQLLREQNTELDKARNANADLSEKLRMTQVSYGSLSDDMNIAQAAVITYKEQIFMAKEEIICKDIQIGELRTKLATVEKNSDGDNTNSTKNTASSDVEQENFKLPKTHSCKNCGKLLNHEMFRSKGINEQVIEQVIERVKQCKACYRDKRMTSTIRCNVTNRLTDTNVRKNSKDDDDVPISRMMSANEYHANQFALQKKAGLATHNA